MQNPPTAIAFPLISYRGQVLAEMFAPLIFSAVFGIFEGVAVLSFYRIAKLEIWRKKTDQSVDELEKVQV